MTINKSKKFFSLAIIFAILFVALTFSLFLAYSNFKKIDYVVGNAVSGLQTSPVSLQFFNLITNFGSIKFITSLSILIAGILLIKNRKRLAKFFLGVLFFGAGSAYLFKELVRRLRPEMLLGFVESGFSYPSAHALLGTVFYGFLAYYLAKRQTEKSKKFLIYVGATIIITLVALSRVVIGVHWGTDVIGGLLLGLSLLFAFIGFYERKNVTQ